MRSHLVSIIITTRDSDRTIEDCLRSAKGQSYPYIEIIVVDNYSRDKTADIASKYATVYLKGPERSSQRNFGARKSNGEYLFFVDSDMEIGPNVVEECVSRVNNDAGIKGAIIPEISVGDGFWARCKALERSCYIGDETIEAARFFEREVFEKMNGYDERIAGGGEEYDLPQRIKDAGFKIARVPSYISHLEGHLALSGTVRKKFYYAQTIGIYMKKHPALFAKQATIFRPAYFRNWRRLIKDPVHTFGFLFMKSCEFSAGALGFLLSRQRNKRRNI